MKNKKMVKAARVTPRALKNAIRGTAGNKSEIARRLGRTRLTILNCLKRPGKKWDKVRAYYKNECDSVTDTAQSTIRDVLIQRKDISSALRAATWQLEKRKKKIYGDEQTVRIEGGKRALKVESKNIVSLDVLRQIPLEQRKILLDAIQKAKKKED